MSAVTVPRLVYPYRNGVKWDPADHLCAADELLPIEPVDNRWAIKRRYRRTSLVTPQKLSGTGHRCERDRS